MIAAIHQEVHPIQVRGRIWQALSLRQQRRLVDRAFEFWRSEGFPVYRLSGDSMAGEFHALSNHPLKHFAEPGFSGSNVCLRVANSYHPQMWAVRVSRYLSPMDVFLDDYLLRKALQRAWTVWPDRFGANPATLRRMLKTFPGAASVSNFRPTAARNIIAALSDDRDTILDFSAGYGGRLIGALSLQRSYIGIEPCERQVDGLQRARSFLRERNLTRGQADIVRGCAEDVLPTMPSRSIDLVFSSPPYYDWEKYSDEPTQSFIRHRPYENWLSGFLRPVIHESYRVLRPSGHLALNISGRLRRPSFEEVRGIARQAGFRFRFPIALGLARVPYMHPRLGPSKEEQLLVWRKS
jgi:SAM-dependent methyltransferase